MNGRVWEVGDLDAIASIERECFPSMAWSRQSLADCLLSEKFYGVLLDEGGVITAYGGMNVVLDEGEIQLVATAEMYRSCGRGKKIMDDLIEEAKRRGVKTLFLEVRISNAPAQKLYLSCGFRGVYARSRYYPDGEDAVVMKKELD